MITTELNGLWQQYQDAHRQGNGTEYKQKLTLVYIPFLRGIAKKLVGDENSSSAPYLEVGDLVNIGVLKLDNVMDEFEFERGVSFEDFAYKRLRGVMIEELRRSSLNYKVNKDSRRLERIASEIASEIGHYPNYDELALGVGQKELERARQDYKEYEKARSELNLELGRKPTAREIDKILKGDTLKRRRNHKFIEEAGAELNDYPLALRLGYQLVDMIQLKNKRQERPSRKKRSRYRDERGRPLSTYRTPGARILTDPRNNRNQPQKVVLREDACSSEPNPSEHEDQLDWSRILTADLSRTDTLIVLLYFYNNQTIRQIGKEIGINHTSIAKRLTRVKKDWRRKFPKERLEELGVIK